MRVKVMIRAVTLTAFNVIMLTKFCKPERQTNLYLFSVSELIKIIVLYYTILYLLPISAIEE